MKTLLRGAATLLTAALLCFNLFYELAPNLVVGPEKKFAFAAAFAVLLRIALFCGIPEAQRQRRRRLYMQLLLYYYMWVLANVLFFDNAFGRGFTTHATLEAINLEPLRTIKNYLLAYGYGNISLRLVILNLAGNLIAFAPMGVFLPAVFRWQRSIFFFTATRATSTTSSLTSPVRSSSTSSAASRRSGTVFAASPRAQKKSKNFITRKQYFSFRAAARMKYNLLAN